MIRDPSCAIVSRIIGRLMARGVIASRLDADVIRRATFAPPDRLAARDRYRCEACGLVVCACVHTPRGSLWRAAWRSFLLSHGWRS